MFILCCTISKSMCIVHSIQLGYNFGHIWILLYLGLDEFPYIISNKHTLFNFNFWNQTPMLQEICIYYTLVLYITLSTNASGVPFEYPQYHLNKKGKACKTRVDE